MAQALGDLAHLDEWHAEDTSVAEIERALAELREPSDLRTSVMTHTAWVPEQWLDAARETLAGLAERHPSRTIILVPRPREEDALDAHVSLQCFPLPGEERHICSEVIELHLKGRRAQGPASIVLPLLLPDLPVFCRWRGRPPFGVDALDDLVEVVDRLVVESREWDEVRDGLHHLAELFDRTVVSDIAWARTLRWRIEIARLWPDVADARELHVTGPESDALLLVGWLRSRLARHVELTHERADEVEAVEVDGQDVALPREPLRSASALLSDELDRFSRDPVYEAAVKGAE
jgi:glucose-6-phosphate dehydrogenase assembly protein OpcA